MIDLAPPIIIDRPAIIRPIESGVWLDIDRKMERLGLPRSVRRSIATEMGKIVGGKPKLLNATAAEMARYAKEPALGSMLVNPFLGTVGGGGGDPSFASVKLLLGFEGADAATATSDESGAAHGAATFVGNAQLDTGQFKFGASSLQLDGTGDYISFPDSADWDLSDANSDQCTVEAWIRPHANGGGIMGQDTGDGTLSFALFLNVGQLTLYFSPTGAYGALVGLSSPSSMSLDAWHHVAMDKDATGKIRLYVDGSKVASSTPGNSAFFNSSAVFKIGTVNVVGDFNGWIDEVRITKGVARYATDSSFTVPAAAFPRS
jgi:hypothetical protein